MRAVCVLLASSAQLRQPRRVWATLTFVTFAGDNTPDPEALAELHRKTKASCFIGNSLFTQVTIEPRS